MKIRVGKQRKNFSDLNDYLDVLIPRGGKTLIETVIREATVPVIQTGAGNCHMYIDETAEQDMAEDIALNAKIQRPSVCNAIETILIHEKWFAQYGKGLIEKLQPNDVEIFGDETVVQECQGVQAGIRIRLVNGISWVNRQYQACFRS